MVAIYYDGVSLNDPNEGVYVDYPEDMGTPPIRGENITIPFRHGSISTPKYFAERPITIQGYVWGNTRAELWQRIDRIKELFSIIKGPRRLEIDWPDGTTRYLICEVHNTMGFQGTHRAFSPFSVELVASDPFWRDDAAAQESPYLLGSLPLMYIGNPEFIIADYDSTYDIVVQGTTETFTVNNPGIMALEDSRVSFVSNSPLSAITLKNLHSGTQFTITYPIPATGTISVDCSLFQATLTSGQNHIDITQYLQTPPGQRAPYIIPVGNSTMQVIFTGTGSLVTTVALYYASAYL